MAHKKSRIQVDLHNHLLPGADDGVQTMEESLIALQGMAERGFRRIYLTPHVRSTHFANTPDRLRPAFEGLRQAAAQANANVQLDLCAEYYMDPPFKEAIRDDAPMLCFPGNYLLMEISMYQEPLDLFEVLFELQNKGYKPILAHPERYPFYWNRTDVYRLLKRAGCLLQVNLFSFAGYYGKEVKAAAEWLHKNLFVDLVATDIHRAKQLELFEDKAVQHLLATADVKNNQFL